MQVPRENDLLIDQLVGVAIAYRHDVIVCTSESTWVIQGDACNIDANKYDFPVTRY
jgi:uncharacterized membrane protein